jgi:hypothetical protein
MDTLIADSSGFWSWTAPEAVDLLTLVVTDPNGQLVDVGTPTNDGLLFSLTIPAALIPRSKMGRWVFDPQYQVTVSGDPAKRSDPREVWLLDAAYGDYGDLSDILGYLGLLLPALTATSNPTLSEVTSLMARQSEEYDLRLSVAGYTVPLASVVGLSQAGRAVSLAVAGQILRRFMTGRGDWPGVATAKGYEADAEDVIMRIIRGSVVLPEKQAPATSNFRRPGVIGTSPATPTSRTREFEERHGTAFDRGSW